MKLLLLLKRWCEHLPRLHSAFSAKLSKTSLGCLSHPLALLLLRGGLPEWLCPAFDSLCIGGSWLAWKSVPEQRLEAWTGLGMGNLVPQFQQFGLPLILTVTLCCSTL